MSTGYPDARVPAPDCGHRTRTNTRTSIEPIGYDSQGAPLYAWQLEDEQATAEALTPGGAQLG
jgi:hypothetical protein